MKVYKLKFSNEKEAQEIKEQIQEGLLEWVCVDSVKMEADVLHKNEKLEILKDFEVFPKVIKHNFL